MSNTYIGWDGKTYPWPPPEGWYHASDGRWWAPDTGPNPPSQAAQPQTPAQAQPTAVAPQSSGPNFAAPQGNNPNPQPADQGNLHTIQFPADADPLATRPFEPPVSRQDQPTSTLSPDNTASFPPSDPGTSQMPVARAPTGQAGRGMPAAGRPPGQGGVFTPAGAPVAPPPKKKGGVGQALLIVFGMIAAVLGGGFAYYYLTSGTGSDTAANTNGTLSADSDTATPGESEADGDVVADEQPSETNPAGAGPSSDSAEDATEVEAPATSPSVEETTTTTSIDTTTTAPIIDLVDGFRATLEENGLTSKTLTDDQIRTFATDFCERARNSSDADEFSDARNDAIEATQSLLSPDELALVINTAVATFCPEEAARLNVTT